MGDVETPLSCRCLALPKAGNRREEYEDAAAWDMAAGRFAVADGASESIFAAEWADILCGGFVNAPPTNDFEAWLAPLRQQWMRAVDGRSMPWYMEEKLRDGAFATFLGLTLTTSGDSQHLSWQAIAVGDSCLFHIRNDCLRLAFPVRSASHFGSRPELIAARPRTTKVSAMAKGELGPGDTLLLTTDALAAWLLVEHEAGNRPWGELAELTDESFIVWADTWRVAPSEER